MKKRIKGTTMSAAGNRPDIRQEINELSLLFEISQILESNMDLRDVVRPVLNTISNYTGTARGVITLLNHKTGEISIKEAVGLSSHQQKRGRYRLGEGITGKVVQSGRPAIIPRISDEPLFLDKTRAGENIDWEDISFLCVPIKIGNEVIGTLSVDRLFTGEAALNEEVRLFSVIASMISQAVKIRQEAQEERKKLLEENIRLQEREFERVGGIETIKTDVRILAATNRNLEELITKNRYREDLYYRLNVFPMHIPPLRERKTDILLLADHFIEKYSRAAGKNIRRISTPAIDMLMAYHWPGNVRELENCIERAVVMSNDDVIQILEYQ